VLPASFNKARHQESARAIVFTTKTAQTTYATMEIAYFAIISKKKKAMNMVITSVPSTQTKQLISTAQFAIQARVFSTNYANMMKNVNSAKFVSKPQLTLPKIPAKAQLAPVLPTVKQFILISLLASFQKARHQETARANVEMTQNAWATYATTVPIAYLVIISKKNMAMNMAITSVPSMQTKQLISTLQFAIQVRVFSHTTIYANPMTNVTSKMFVYKQQPTLPKKPVKARLAPVLLTVTQFTLILLLA
jgi:hypothetical protein